MSAAQPRRLVLLDHHSLEREERPHMRVQIDDLELHDRFIDYLQRLGCTVNVRGAGTFEVSVTYPETVDDEAAAIAEWSASWSDLHAPSIALVIPDGSGADRAGTTPGTEGQLLPLAP
jgi:hypothetical protein